MNAIAIIACPNRLDNAAFGFYDAYSKDQNGEGVIMADGVTKPELSLQPRTGLSLQSTVEEQLLSGMDVTDAHFVGETLQDVGGTLMEFSGCIFERCTFGTLAFKRMSFVDCAFEKCELCNCRMPDATFQRVSFAGCRMTGLEITNAALMNATFDSCMLDYLSVADSKLERVLWHSCPMRESLWSNVKLGKTRFESCNLKQAQWTYTSLKDIDMTTCELEGWAINPADLRGIRVASAQAILLSTMLGIVIAD